MQNNLTFIILKNDRIKLIVQLSLMPHFMKFAYLKKPNLTSRTESLLVVVVAAIILFIRKTDSILNPQFWAEDRTVFFLDQYHDGVSSVFQPHAGYLHLVPRIIALLADLVFTVPAAPYVYNYLS